MRFKIWNCEYLVVVFLSFSVLACGKKDGKGLGTQEASTAEESSKEASKESTEEPKILSHGDEPVYIMPHYPTGDIAFANMVEAGKDYRANLEWRLALAGVTYHIRSGDEELIDQLVAYAESYTPPPKTTPGEKNNLDGRNLMLPPGVTLAFPIATFCLDHGLKTPGEKAPFEATPITSENSLRLLTLAYYAANPQSDPGNMQGLIWSLEDMTATSLPTYLDEVLDYFELDYDSGINRMNLSKQANVVTKIKDLGLDQTPDDLDVQIYTYTSTSADLILKNPSTEPVKITQRHLFWTMKPLEGEEGQPVPTQLLKNPNQRVGTGKILRDDQPTKQELDEAKRWAELMRKIKNSPLLSEKEKEMLIKALKFANSMKFRGNKKTYDEILDEMDKILEDFQGFTESKVNEDPILKRMILIWEISNGESYFGEKPLTTEERVRKLLKLADGEFKFKQTVLDGILNQLGLDGMSAADILEIKNLFNDLNDAL